MTKRPRPASPATRTVSAHPLRLLASLPALRILSPDIAEPTPPAAEGTETVHHAEQNVRLRFHSTSFAPGLFADNCSGALYVAESALMFWVGSETDGKGFAVPYEKIAIHAVSRGSEASDGNEGEPACVYVQLMGSDAVDENGAVLERPAAGHGNGNGNAETAEDNEEDDDDEESDPRYDEDEEEMYELKLVPENSASLDSIFLSLSICMDLHPDASSDTESPFRIMGEGDGEASANAAMVRLFAAGTQIGQEGGPSLGELLGPGWVTADSLQAEEGGEDAEGRFEDAEKE